MRNLHKYRSLGFVFLGLSLLFGLLLALDFLFVSNPKRIEAKVQRKVSELQNDLNSIAVEDLKSAEFANREIGLYVYSNDSLVSWNQNSISSRLLKRRSVLGRDTICNLLSGNYFVHSFQHNNRSYYLFKCLNTNYKIDNKFFPNEFFLLHSLADIRVVFTNEETAYKVRIKIIWSADSLMCVANSE